MYVARQNGCRRSSRFCLLRKCRDCVRFGYVKKLNGGCMERRSPYRNPITRLDPRSPAKTFKIFSSAGSAASWLRVQANAERVIKVRKWADGKVAVTYFGAVRSSYRIKLAPERRISPELYALEQRRDACTNVA